MSKTLNFNNVKKRYLTVTLADEKNTVLMIGMPTKATLNDLFSMQETLTTLESDTDNMEAANELYAICARIMSRNKTDKKIEVEYLEELFDLEDIVLFFNAYMDFVDEIKNEKN